MRIGGLEKISQVELMDLQGRRMTLTLSNSNEFSLVGIPKGIWALSIKNETTTFLRKIVIP
jgi:hypothetical protein